MNKNNFIFPRIPEEFIETLRQQLQRQGNNYKFAHIAATVICPILEAIIVGVIVSLSTTEDDNTQLIVVLIIILLLIITLHGVVAWISFSTITPLSQFLLEFNEQSKTLADLERRYEEILLFSSAFTASLKALELSIITALSSLSQSPPLDQKTLLQKMLEPWNDSRAKIFNFQGGEYLHNFAIYLLDKEKNELVIEARICDDRIRRKDRSWFPGDGQVGSCFQQRRLLISGNLSDSPSTSDDNLRPEDPDYYKSFIGHPLRQNREVIGVLVITSSAEKQFIEAVHSPIIQAMAKAFEVGLSFTSMQDSSKAKEGRSDA